MIKPSPTLAYQSRLHICLTTLCATFPRAVFSQLDLIQCCCRCCLSSIFCNTKNLSSLKFLPNCTVLSNINDLSQLVKLCSNFQLVLSYQQKLNPLTVSSIQTIFEKCCLLQTFVTLSYLITLIKLLFNGPV